MKNSIKIFSLLILFLISCENIRIEEQIASPNNTLKKLRPSPNVKNDLILRFSKSKNVNQLYNIMVEDKSSGKIKKNKNWSNSEIKNLPNLSQEEIVKIVEDKYIDSKLKLAQLNRIFETMNDLHKEFSEIDSYEEIDRKEIIFNGLKLFSKGKFKNARPQIPNPDQCFGNCGEVLGQRLTSAWNQFVYGAWGCGFGSLAGGIWAPFVWGGCMMPVAAMYDQQWYDGYFEYDVCISGSAGYPWGN